MKTHPSLGPDELRRLRWILGGSLLLLSAGSVFLMDAGCGIAAGAAFAGIAAGLLRPDLPARVPAWVHRLAFPAIVLAFVGDLGFGDGVLQAMIRLDLLLLLYRGLSYRKRRDDLQIVVLGLFLIVVGGVLTISPVFAVQILAFTGMALALLATVTLTEDPWSSSASAPAPARPGPGTAPAWALRGGTRPLLAKLLRVADWRILTLGAVLFAGVIALSAGLFLAIPRFQIEASFLPGNLLSRKARTGFGETIRFGDVTDISEDESVAFNVDLSAPPALPAVPYWRMLVLDDYRDGSFRLSPSLRLAAFSAERSESAVAGGYGSRAPSPVWTFYLEPGVSRFLPLAGRFGSVQFRQVQVVRAAPALAVVALREEPATMTAYRVTGMPADSDLIPDPGYAHRLRARDAPHAGPLLIRLGLGSDDRLILARLAAEAASGGASGAQIGPVSGSGPDAATFADRAGAWLRARHGYSLSPRIPPGPGDPLVRWMASGEPGHCELFAGSLVLLARAAGFPARVVVGFKGGSWNAYSGSFTVRDSGAHAWAEIWEARRGGWLRADPLEPPAIAGASSGASASASSRLERGWSARLNGLRVFWYRRIVNFDQRTQLDALAAARRAGSAAGRSVGSFFARAREWVRSPWGVRRVLRILAGAAGGAAAAAIFIQCARAARARLAGRPGRPGFRPDPVRRSAARWLRRLDGPEDLVGSLQRLRYGPPGTWPDPGAVFSRARREARRRGPGGRRSPPAR